MAPFKCRGIVTRVNQEKLNQSEEDLCNAISLVLVFTMYIVFELILCNSSVEHNLSYIILLVVLLEEIAKINKIIKK